MLRALGFHWGVEGIAARDFHFCEFCYLFTSITPAGDCWELGLRRGDGRVGGWERRDEEREGEDRRVETRNGQGNRVEARSA